MAGCRKKGRKVKTRDKTLWISLRTHQELRVLPLPQPKIAPTSRHPNHPNHQSSIFPPIPSPPRSEDPSPRNPAILILLHTLFPSHAMLLVRRLITVPQGQSSGLEKDAFSLKHARILLLGSDRPSGLLGSASGPSPLPLHLAHLAMPSRRWSWSSGLASDPPLIGPTLSSLTMPVLCLFQRFSGVAIPGG